MRHKMVLKQYPVTTDKTDFEISQLPDVPEGYTNMVALRDGNGEGIGRWSRPER